ncbi:amidase signature domain-containing protein [Podospora appendiculata]|uniref:Amidase signature domain-containing protein n=1 Tax=Podospora appendiculata TaxID=314037 RepID=A0AAE1CF16_9PEZI|nr:amidase signature domain-containing protein [Podospora appendiculata]
MASAAHTRRLLNYPEPLKGPDIPYKNDRKPNPVVRGRTLLAAALVMEWFRFVREMVWRNAGFGSLRKIIPHIEDYEPLFEPQVVPYPDPDPSGADEDADAVTPEETKPDAQASYPEAKYYSAAEYRHMFLTGALTPTDVAKALLPLIRRDVPDPSPHSIAFFETKVDKVLAAARASTERYKENRSLGPLDGVPTAVKDEYDMQGYLTCLGSKNDYTGALLEEDSYTTWCVRKLEDAGAIILGKLSMHEFGLDTSGHNPVYSTPLNPHNPNYYTGGSSSGTGYVVAAGLIPIGLGSDGGGSIRIPSSMCGVFGLKPTHGRLSFKPGQNHSLTCACLGPIASDIDSLATVFQIISQPHPKSPFPPMRPLRLTPSPSSPKVLGICLDWVARATPDVQRLYDDMVQRLVSEHGYHLVQIHIPFLAEGQTAHAMTVLTDAATLLPDTHNLTAGNRILLALGRVTPATDYMLAQKLRRLLMQHLAWLWQQHPGMLIVTPTTSCEGWPIRGGQSELARGVNDGDRTLQSMEFVWLANFCGLPSISVPAGVVTPSNRAVDKAQTDEIPVGLMATGEWCAEEQLLQFGKAAEMVGAGLMRRPRGWVDVVQLAHGVRGA